jgi:hypothetical protein
LLADLEDVCARLVEVGLSPIDVDFPHLASRTGTDLTRQPAADFIGAEDGVDVLLAALSARRDELGGQAAEQLRKAAEPLLARVEAWKVKHAAWQEKMAERQRDLAARGLTVQAGEIVRVAQQLDGARRTVSELKARKQLLDQAEAARRGLVTDFHQDRDAEHLRRKTMLRGVVADVNEQADGMHIHVAVDQNADDRVWCEWLSANLGFRQPRVSRIAAEVDPRDFASALRRDRNALAALQADGAAMLSAEQLDLAAKLRTYPILFELETMLRHDRVRLSVSEHQGAAPRAFNHLSAGQQRSVLLSLLLSAKGDDPLVVDQPEDHLDASYIARSVVRQLEGAKERRQVIIATHSPNLTVLGDAELVIPMYASAGHAEPCDPGAVDRPATREHVCTLLEGGEQAYERRGARYGFDVQRSVR